MWKILQTVSHLSVIKAHYDSIWPQQNIPVEQPWQMIAVDILQVPLLTNNNRYLVIIQDNCTKWADIIPLPDETVYRITAELIKFFCMYGPPQILHSNQDRNFENTIFTQVLDAFDVHKSCTTPYYPQGDGMDGTIVQWKTFIVMAVL